MTMLRAEMPEDEASALAAALSGDGRVTSIRLNRQKTELYGLPCTAAEDAVPWCADGRYLAGRPQFTFDPLLHAGCYYVQEASSMFLEQALGQHLQKDKGCVALDLCAAPGGKSTHLRQLLPGGSLLVSNEYVRQRANVLAENMTKWGHPDVIVTNNAPADFARLQAAFDVIVADVPCSGEGMFRKDETAVAEWSTANVEMCRQRQRDIIADVWQALKGGGLLVYSTCTFNTREDEENVAWIASELGADILPVALHDGWDIAGNMLRGADFPVCRFLPGRIRGEGFFMAVLRKREDNAAVCTGKSTASRDRNRRIAQANPLLKKSFSAVSGWIDGRDDMELMAVGEGITAFTTPYIYMVRSMMSLGFRILHAGVPLAVLKGKDLVPQHALAMSTALNAAAFASVALDFRQAVAYLQGSAVQLPPSAPRGFVLLTYCGVPLGFAKNLGTRANNLYPQEWRIRSSFVPDSPPTVIVK